MFDKTEMMVLQIEGMSCAHCVKRVEEALRAVKGVKSAKADLANKTAQVTYVPAKTGKEQLVQAVEKAGFKAG